MASGSIQKSLISNASKKFIATLVKCAKDIIKGDIELTKYQLRLLKPYERMMERFIERKESVDKKKTLLQKGGFLKVLIKPLAAMLIDGLLKRPRRR